jgi:hypothetical protein
LQVVVQEELEQQVLSAVVAAVQEDTKQKVLILFQPPLQ